MQRTKQAVVLCRKPAQCTVHTAAPGDQSGDRSNRLTLECKFNRRSFDVKFENREGCPTNLEELTEAIEKETGIPPNKQCILLNGIKMNPPDTKSMTSLDNLNVKSGDQVLIMNSCRLGTDDDDKEMFEQLREVVKITNKEISEIFYKVDQVEHGCVPDGQVYGVLNSLRTQAISLEKRVMGFIETAHGIRLDYRNAVDQARRRQMMDQCQRQLDKVRGMISAIFDRLAQANANVDGISIYTIQTKAGPCVNKGPCK